MEKVVTLTTPQDKLKAALDTLAANVPFVIEMHKISAKVKREAYLAYIKEGFTEEQALELTKGVQ